MSIAEHHLAEARLENDRLRREIARLHKRRGSDPTHEFTKADMQAGVNIVLEQIATKFEANDTWDIWRSDAAALVRGFKHPTPANG